MDTTLPAAAGTAGYGYADLPALISLMTGDSKHDGAAASTLDLLWVLYDRVLRVSPGTAMDDARDRFLLSKGHGPMAYYAVLAAGPAPGPQPRSRGGDLQRLAGARPAAGDRDGAGPAGPGPDRSPGVRADRRRGTGRGLQSRGDRLRSCRPARRTARRRGGQLLVHPRLAGRDRDQVRHRGLVGAAGAGAGPCSAGGGP